MSEQLRSGAFIEAVESAANEASSLFGKVELRSTRRDWSGEWYVQSVEHKGVLGIEVVLTPDYDSGMKARAFRDRVHAIGQWSRTDPLAAVTARVTDSAIKRSGILSVEADPQAGLLLVQGK